MLITLFPILALCSIRRLNNLAPFALAANVIYLAAVGIVVWFFFSHLQDSETLTKFGRLHDLPQFFSMVRFVFYNF